MGLLLLVMLASLLALVITVLCYGYRRPNTKLGLLMIKVYNIRYGIIHIVHVFYMCVSGVLHGTCFLGTRVVLYAVQPH